jgi:hypothetical protein
LQCPRRRCRHSTESRSYVMRWRMLWPLAIVIFVMALLDGVLWYLASQASSSNRTGLVSSASALLVAVVGVGGTAVGAYLTAEYARGTARLADRRAAYARFLGASAAYREDRRRADTSKVQKDRAFAAWKKLKDQQATNASSVKQEELDSATSLAQAWADQSKSAAEALPSLQSDLQVSAAAARLSGPQKVRSVIDALETALLEGKASDTEFTRALESLSADTQ